MPVETLNFSLIEDATGLEEFARENKEVEWLAFDSEFIGERRFVTLLCLIQVATENGFYLLDTLKIKDLQPFLEMLSDEKIIKITHAGDNDYRLLNTLFGLVPKNVFDLQIAAGFLGYKYPVSFRKLVESELDIRLAKGYTVANWEQRPFRKKQLSYALQDVMYLQDLWRSLDEQLAASKRYAWAKEEFRELEKPSYYEKDPYKEALGSNLIKSLTPREQVFLIRLFAWRTDEARRKNYSKEMVLPGKYISPIIRCVSSGKDALQHNRRLPEKMVNRYGDIFIGLFEPPPSLEEMELLTLIPKDNSDHPKQDLMIEMLYLMVRYKCLEQGVSADLVLPRNILKKLKADKDYFDESLKNTWRQAFLGEEIINWLEFRNQLKFDFGQGKFELKMKSNGQQKG